LPALTVNWGAVSGVGYVAQNPEIGEKLDQFGVKSLPAQQMLAILGELLQHGAVQVGVGHLDWAQLAKIHMIGASPRFAHLAEVSLSDDAEAVGTSLIDAIMAVEPAERQQFLEANIREQLARVLGISPSKLDVDRPLLNLGLDSLMALEIGNQIQSMVGVEVPAVKILEGLSVSGLAAYVIERLVDTSSLPPAPSAGDEAAAGELLARVEQLSDEEVDTLLRELVAEEAVEPLDTERELSR
jgi:acyl carrier protein